MKLSIIIPILNEEKNIIPLTDKIRKVLKNVDYELIFVDDSSNDKSRKILKYLKNKFNFFKPILRSKDRDLTQSCFDGIKIAKFKNILIMDGDMQHDPKYIKKMFHQFKKNKNDIVIGARKLNIKNKGLSETRRFVSNILIFLFKIFKIKTTDPMSGFFLFKKEIYFKSKNNYFGKGFKILADILINSKSELKTEDVYIDFKRRYESKSKMNFKILIILIQFYLRSIFKKLFI